MSLRESEARLLSEMQIRARAALSGDPKAAMGLGDADLPPPQDLILNVAASVFIFLVEVGRDDVVTLLAREKP